MNQTIKLKTDPEFKLVGIDLLNVILNLPAHPEKSIAAFYFTINTEQKINSESRIIAVVVTVDIFEKGKPELLGHISVGNLFQIGNFEDLVTIDNENHAIVEQRFSEVLNSIAISTTRGVIFSSFRGTYLHNAFLPIIDPKHMKINQ